MKILFVAPLPPPITGHSLVSKVLFDYLLLNQEVKAVDIRKKNFKEGIDGFNRIKEVIGIIKKVCKYNREADVIYLTISESFAGNLKDIIIYLTCFNKLSKMVIHLHGGTIKKSLWEKYKLLFFINRFFISRMGGVIISGISHLNIFRGVIPENKIHIVSNFSQDYLFLDEERIIEKFSDVTSNLRILYMSNLIPKKGFNELADSYFLLDDDLKKKVQLDFAGGFDSEEARMQFINKIKDFKQLKYHGLVDNNIKRQLFSRAHIFCLPTSYLEGQPVSILEAYASGCVVLTTGQQGILDIFTDKINGLQILEKSPSDIAKKIEKILAFPDTLLEIGLFNNNIASDKYRDISYNKAIENILLSISQIG